MHGVFNVTHISSAVDRCDQSIKIPSVFIKEPEFQPREKQKVSSDKRILYTMAFAYTATEIQIYV